MSEERISMQGRRIETPASWETLKVGDYFKDADGLWWVTIPGMDPTFPFRIQNPGQEKTTWQVEEHEDGTITVSPSLHMIGYWHGFLRRGRFESC